MKNPFSLSDEKLRILLNALSDWYDKDEEEKKYPGDQRLRAEDLQKTLLNKHYLSSVSDDELAEKVFVWNTGTSICKLVDSSTYC